MSDWSILITNFKNFIADDTAGFTIFIYGIVNPSVAVVSSTISAFILSTNYNHAVEFSNLLGSGGASGDSLTFTVAPEILYINNLVVSSANTRTKAIYDFTLQVASKTASYTF